MYEYEIEVHDDKHFDVLIHSVKIAVHVYLKKEKLFFSNKSLHATTTYYCRKFTH